MMFTVKTENAIWTYDQAKGKIKCLGDIYRCKISDSKSHPMMWAETNGTYREGILFRKHEFFWYKKEKEQAIKQCAKLAFEYECAKDEQVKMASVSIAHDGVGYITE